MKDHNKVFRTSSKLLANALALIAVMLTKELWQLALWIILFLFLACASGVFKSTFKRLLPFFYIVICMLLIHSLLNPLNHSYWFFFGLEGLEYSSRIGLRLISIVLLANLLLLTTSTNDLIIQIGRVNPDLGIIFGLLLSILPVMRKQLQTTLDVQEARGLNYRDKLLKRLKAYIAVIVPVIIQSINRAHYMAQLLYLRGYNGQKSNYSESWRQADYLLLLASCLLLGLVIYSCLA